MRKKLRKKITRWLVAAVIAGLLVSRSASGGVLNNSLSGLFRNIKSSDELTADGSGMLETLTSGISDQNSSALESILSGLNSSDFGLVTDIISKYATVDSATLSSAPSGIKGMDTGLINSVISELSSIDSGTLGNILSEISNTVDTSQAVASDAQTEEAAEGTAAVKTAKQSSASQNGITVPSYSGTPSVEVNNNIPLFTASDLTTEAFEKYSGFDSLGRCGAAYANICKELMPEEERGEIGQIKPSGWHTVKYNGYIEGNYLYNRCHLIGFQLAGENANEKNLITGTRYLNVNGMLPYENMVSSYIYDHPQNHVLYRVTPVFSGNNLVASGVLMEAYSVEDSGAGVCFCVFCYNVQPGIIIDYATGESSLDESYTGEYATENQFSGGK